MESWVIVDAIKVSNIPLTQLTQIFAHTGIVGASLAQPWKVVEPQLGTYDFSVADALSNFCESNGKKFAWRIRAGQHTPPFRMGRSWVPQGTTQYDIARGKTIPVPFNFDGSVNSIFMIGLRKLFTKVNTWAETNALDIYHSTWFGGLSAEMYATEEMTRLAGYSPEALAKAYNQIVLATQNRFSSEITVEFPLGGMGGPPFVNLQKTVVPAIQLRVDPRLPNYRPQYVQINWLDDRAGDKDTLVNWRFGPLPPHGLQMIHAEEYDWVRVFERAKLNGAEYVEFYHKQFFFPSAPKLYEQIALAS